MNINKNTICVVAPRKGMGDCISFFGIFKTISKFSKKKNYFSYSTEYFSKRNF